MENKKYIYCLLVIICISFILIGFFNYEKIISFFSDKNWEIIESFATIQSENISQVESGKMLLLLTNNSLSLYNNSSEKEFSENIVITEIISNSCESYMAVVSKDNNTIYLFKDSELLWKKDFNWNILNVSVNKNGYLTVIYSQSGYKSSIKIFKPTGDELFTTYLASTYALDVEISNDNKFLYIAEIDTEGIKIKSNIKIIEISNIEPGINLTPKVETLLVGTDYLITDIEYNNENKLLVLKESGIDYLDSDKILKTFGSFDVKTTLFASVDNSDAPVIIEKVSTGIFTNETNLKVFTNDEVIETKINRTPQSIDVMHNKIALNLGDEVVFYNTNGKIVKRYELENQLVSVKLYDNGNKAALVFRNRIELLKL